LDVRDQLLRLVRLQEVALEVRRSRDVVESAPARIEEVEGHFRERNAEYVAVKQRFDALEEDQRRRSGELEELEESRKKYMDDLMGVQNQREYAAMLKEIDSVKARIVEHEDAILKDMEEIETVKVDLASHETHIQEERKHVEEEHAEIQATADTASEAIALLSEERTRIESELPRNLLAAVRRLEVGRQGLFLSKAEEGICQSCFVRVRPQGFQEIKLAIKVHYCSNCKRLLYHEPSINPPAEPAEGAITDEEAGTPPEGGKDTVEVVNGGAV